MRAILARYIKRSVDCLFRKILARPGIRAYLQGLWGKYRKEVTGAVADAGELAELLPLNARMEPSGSVEGARLNLLVPAVSVRHVFGGIATALQLFDALRPHFTCCRIIVTDEVSVGPSADAFFGGWPVVSLDEPGPVGDHIVVAGSRWMRSLPVGENDFFMATAWWTAHHGFALLQQMMKLHATAEGRRLLYLIQDYEPGFYPWSARHVLARSTYARAEQTVALVNSQELAEHLNRQGHRFVHQLVFDPRLNPALASLRYHLAGTKKARILLAYTRPSVERNAFPLVVAALRSWAATYSEARHWKILGLGEDFTPIDLGCGCVLESLGKLTLQGYAELLAEAAVGLSLMVSPHPSYPPLEMAAYGLRVLTNSFSTKDLSTFSRQITSISEFSAEGLATALIQLTHQFDQLSMQKRYFVPHEINLPPTYLDSKPLRAEDLLGLVEKLKGG